ncbi:MAG: acetyltransferase [Cyclobacteriaceae bacterium]|nr:MAG: acetyltransferase [Cyclobacteriaceae bacterium]
MPAWVQEYLNRIQYHRQVDPNYHNLKNIHQAHLYNVPFENLDIQWNIPFSLDLKHLKNKVIRKYRGGFCYELNYLFGNLLQELGFEVKYLSARVFDDKGQPGPEFDHMTLLVKADKICLADVGFGGKSFIQPLILATDRVQADVAGRYRIDKLGLNEFRLNFSTDAMVFQPLYDFNVTPEPIDHFLPQCIWKETNECSHFVRNKICTLATIDGRKSLLNKEFTIRKGDQKVTRELESIEQETEVLRKHFKIY